MNFPGGSPLGGLGAQNAGLSEQQMKEQQMIKYVSDEPFPGLRAQTFILTCP